MIDFVKRPLFLFYFLIGLALYMGKYRQTKIINMAMAISQLNKLKNTNRVIFLDSSLADAFQMSALEKLIVQMELNSVTVAVNYHDVINIITEYGSSSDVGIELAKKMIHFMPSQQAVLGGMVLLHFAQAGNVYRDFPRMVIVRTTNSIVALDKTTNLYKSCLDLILSAGEVIINNRQKNYYNVEDQMLLVNSLKTLGESKMAKETMERVGMLKE